MLKKNVISQQRHLFLTNLYRKNWSLLLADGGEGLIHGSPTDAEESKADKVVFLHLDKLPERFRAQFSVASSGKRFTIISGQTDYWLTKTIEFVLGYFPDMSPNWISNLLGDLEIRTFNSDDIIIRQGAISRGEVYIVLTGYAKVIYHDGEENRLLAEVEAGELIGEMASFQGDGLRNASVVALSPVVVATFSEDAFRNFITSLGYKDKLTRLWKHRNFLQKFKCLYFLSQQVIRVLAGKARLASVEESAAPQSLLDICETGSLVFPITDDFRFYEDSEQLPVTKNVNILLADEKISYLADTASQILVIDSVEVKKLQETTPIFRYFIKEELPFHFTS
ncbi:MAG: cyclic nucleotide-binding domain-containing protein [Spirochaetota bacterium]